MKNGIVIADAGPIISLALIIMDYGESESLILYKETQADFILIDDKKARNIAENFGASCIGTLGLLAVAKNKNLIAELRPLFREFLKNKRSVCTYNEYDS